MVLTLERETADYYEAAVAHGGTKRDGKAVANLVIGDIAAYANSQGLSDVRDAHHSRRRSPASSTSSATGTISGKIAKDLLQIIIAEEQERRSGGDRRARAA